MTDGGPDGVVASRTVPEPAGRRPGRGAAWAARARSEHAEVFFFRLRPGGVGPRPKAAEAIAGKSEFRCGTKAVSTSSSSWRITRRIPSRGSRSTRPTGNPALDDRARSRSPSSSSTAFRPSRGPNPRASGSPKRKRRRAKTRRRTTAWSWRRTSPARARIASSRISKLVDRSSPRLLESYYWTLTDDEATVGAKFATATVTVRKERRRPADLPWSWSSRTRLGHQLQPRRQVGDARGDDGLQVRGGVDDVHPAEEADGSMDVDMTQECDFHTVSDN